VKIALLTTDSREHFKDYVNPSPYFGTAPQALLEGFASLPGIEVHVISCLQQAVRSPEKLAPNIWYHDLIVPKIGWLRSGYSGCITGVRRILKKIRPDIVHGQGTERDCALSAVFSGFPNLLTIHGNMRRIAEVNHARPFSFAWLTALIESFTLPRTEGVICLSSHTRDAVSGLARRTWLLPNAVDSSFFGAPRDPSGVPIILCVGVVCHHKNQNRLIQALDSLAASRAFRLVFIGGTNKEPYSDEFRQLVAHRPWCEYGGMAARPELREWFGRATLVALPSLEENCPMVVLESMAVGVPVVAAKVGGVPDLVEDRVTGILCDPHDPASMAGAVATVLEDPALAATIAAHARHQAHRRFYPTVVAERHLEIYRELLSTSA